MLSGPPPPGDDADGSPDAPPGASQERRGSRFALIDSETQLVEDQALGELPGAAPNAMAVPEPPSQADQDASRFGNITSDTDLILSPGGAPGSAPALA